MALTDTVGDRRGGTLGRPARRYAFISDPHGDMHSISVTISRPHTMCVVPTCRIGANSEPGIEFNRVRVHGKKKNGGDEEDLRAHRSPLGPLGLGGTLILRHTPSAPCDTHPLLHAHTLCSMDPAAVLAARCCAGFARMQRNIHVGAEAKARPLTARPGLPQPRTHATAQLHPSPALGLTAPS